VKERKGTGGKEEEGKGIGGKGRRDVRFPPEPT